MGASPGSTAKDGLGNMGQQGRAHVSVGLLAHVDAGKTTMAEALLYLSGVLRKAGRVDHKDTFLDTYALERARGITIFSKQARMRLGGKDVTLLDTPGHVDFSAEMERTLQVLDYAVLIISAPDGVTSHVETLWKLLRRYRIPVFLFVNKMDLPSADKDSILETLRQRLSGNCIDFTDLGSQETQESLALCDEEAMESYLRQGMVERGQIVRLVKERKAYPCCFGSALRLEGIREFMGLLSDYMEAPSYPETFGARVFKISRDEQGMRLTHMKVTGGSLRVKALLQGQGGAWQEKADQIRLYSGVSYEMAQEVFAGEICAVTGLTQTFAGEGLGAEQSANLSLLTPVMTYRLFVPEGCNVHALLQQLRQLEEEEPLLRIVWEEEVGEIHVQLMGEVQTEVLQTMIEERFGVSVTFGAGSIIYKETILEPVEGVGHFEPLRHYAEVHLLLEPGEPGSGLVFASSCSEDVLDRNWQRLVLTHLEEKAHKGVLVGAEITDMRITLVSGRSHPKHTEGGDFRQATYRAVRQGLMMARCCLLEPIYQYRLEVPAGQVGHAMADIQRMCGNFSEPEPDGERMVLSGTAPVSEMQGYQSEVLSYTHGKGRLSCAPAGYARCHNEEEVIAAFAYDPERDVENPSGSVFCAHGAGYVVPYGQVYEHMHLELAAIPKERLSGEHARGEGNDGEGREWLSGKHMQGGECDGEGVERFSRGHAQGDGSLSGRQTQGAQVFAEHQEEEQELKEIFERTYGSRGQGQARRGYRKAKGSAGERQGLAASHGSRGDGKAQARRMDYGNAPDAAQGEKYANEREYLLVDGYNIIFSWDDLNDLARTDMAAARGKLMDLLCNYQGYKKNILILVFDAYKVEGNPGESQDYHNIHVVYTKEAETADQYIEKVTHEIGKKHKVTVATSDGLEQVIILGQGARRMSASDLREEIETVNREIGGVLSEHVARQGRTYLFGNLAEEEARALEEIRMGKSPKE